MSDLQQDPWHWLPGLVAMYMMPSIVALLRGKSGVGSLILFNLVFGWTLIGWCVCGFWAWGQTKRQAAALALAIEAQRQETVDRRAFYRREAERR